MPDLRTGAGTLKQDRQKAETGFADLLSTVGAEPASAPASPQDTASSPTKTGFAQPTPASAPGLLAGVPEAAVAVDGSTTGLATVLAGVAPATAVGDGTPLAVGGQSHLPGAPARAGTKGSAASTLRDLVQGLAGVGQPATAASVSPVPLMPDVARGPSWSTSSTSPAPELANASRLVQPREQSASSLSLALNDGPAPFAAPMDRIAAAFEVLPPFDGVTAPQPDTAQTSGSVAEISASVRINVAAPKAKVPAPSEQDGSSAAPSGDEPAAVMLGGPLSQSSVHMTGSATATSGGTPSPPPRPRRDTTAEATAGAIAGASTIVPLIAATQQVPTSLPWETFGTTKLTMARTAVAGSLGPAPSESLSTEPRRPLTAKDDALVSAGSSAASVPTVPPVAAAEGEPKVAPSLAQTAGSVSRPVAPMPGPPGTAAGFVSQSVPAITTLTDVVVTTAIAPAVQGDFARRLASRDPAATATAAGTGEPQPGDTAAAAETGSGAGADMRPASTASAASFTVRGLFAAASAVPGAAGAQVALTDAATDPATAISRDDARGTPKRTGDIPLAVAGTPDAIQAAATGAAPLQPVANAMIAPIKAIVETAAALAAAAAQPDSGPSGAPILAPAKTMTVQLSHGDLGTIVVRMHLVGQTLDLQLSTADNRTASLIGRDRDALSGALRDRHFDLRSLVIQGSDIKTSGDFHATANDPAGDGSRPGAGSEASGSAYGGPSAGSGGSAREGRGSAAPSAQGNRSPDAADPALGSGDRPRSSALYV